MESDLRKAIKKLDVDIGKCYFVQFSKYEDTYDGTEELFAFEHETSEKGVNSVISIFKYCYEEKVWIKYHNSDIKRVLDRLFESTIIVKDKFGLNGKYVNILMVYTSVHDDIRPKKFTKDIHVNNMHLLDNIDLLMSGVNDKGSYKIQQIIEYHNYARYQKIDSIGCKHIPYDHGVQVSITFIDREDIPEILNMFIMYRSLEDDRTYMNHLVIDEIADTDNEIMTFKREAYFDCMYSSEDYLRYLIREV